jgi:Zn finger protein HypA/HybF involved in hydrogenase expression
VVPPRYSESQAREAIAASRSWAEALRRLGMCDRGGAHRVLQRYARTVWEIDTAHFDPAAARLASLGRPARPLAEVLVEGSTVKSAQLKERLYREGIKTPACELCGQGEQWRGRPMALILDHVNGPHDDNRLENLRIVCPNCNATLDTHCGRNARRRPAELPCARCGTPFRPRSSRQRYCSAYCGQRRARPAGPRPEARRVERPPHDELLALVRELGWSAVGRRYGVSDNAVRKWVRAYERAASVPADVAADPADRVEVDV